MGRGCKFGHMCRPSKSVPAVQLRVFACRLPCQSIGCSLPGGGAGAVFGALAAALGLPVAGPTFPLAPIALLFASGASGFFRQSVLEFLPGAFAGGFPFRGSGAVFEVPGPRSLCSTSGC